MNDINARYANHMRDVYGAQVVGIPAVGLEELGRLTERLTTLAQPIYLLDARQRDLDGYQQREETHIWRDGTIVNPSLEVLGLMQPANAVEQETIALAQVLAMTLQLDELVTLEDEGRLNVSNLRRVSKTAHWLYRNLQRGN